MAMVVGETERTIPPYLSPGLVGRANRISRKAAMTKLTGAGILERIGSNWCVGETRLRDRLPEMYERVYAHIVVHGRK